jgi:D-beta-D-heptose 7-phosphate kinase/D-beta-D-heptose 1-phosphate adenosyltransferase
VEDPHPIEGGMEEKILHAVEDFLEEGGDVIILSDYGKGVVTPRLCQEIILKGKKAGVPTLVDPKGSSYEKYRSAYLLSPNQKELATATHVPPKDISLLLSKGEELRKGLDLTYIALTRSEEGITLLSSEGVKHFPAQARQVFDVTGAGDTVIATIAFGIVGGLPIEDSLRLANLSAGIVVGKVGTVPVPWEEFQEEVEKNLLPYSFQRKIVNRETLKNLVEIWRRKGETIVFTNGCFDLLHLGHIRYLEKARSLGDRLIVAINTDDSVRKLKGKGRPIIPEKERAELISSLEMVSLVTLFSEETPLSLIQEIRPDILVKGGDYTKEKIVGAKEVLQYGGKVEIIPYLEGYSTTLLLKKILKGSG